ncbi:hypothetical protein PENSPDRAFT_757041 [Peniophora sp. CONT]|nr:hypothetical protein PENSPDRAFT_757041 [Peniophora sp. CONT]
MDIPQQGESGELHYIAQVEEHLERHLLERTTLLNIREHRPRLAVQLIQDADALARLSALASRFRTAANSAQPISLLPPELFDLIVSYVAESEPPFPPMGKVFDHDWDEPGPMDPTDAGRARPATLGWLHLTHVCKIWRDRIINHSALWAQSIGLLPDAIPEFLRRAGSVRALDLTVRGTPLNKWHTPSLTSLVPNRLRSIAWTLSSGTDRARGFEPMQKMLTGRDFPALETLHLSCLPDYISSQRPSEPLHATALKRIDMTGLFFAFTAPNLVHFRVEDPPELLFTVPTMLDIFASCPLLETFGIHTSYDMRDVDLISQRREPIVLRNLETLAIHAPLSGQKFVEILYNIHLPPHVSLNLHPVSEPIHTPEDFALVTSVISSYRVGRPVGLQIEDDVLTFAWDEPDVTGFTGGATIITGLHADVLLERLSTIENKEHLRDVMLLGISNRSAYQARAIAWLPLFNSLPQITKLNLIGPPPDSVGGGPYMWARAENASLDASEFSGVFDALTPDQDNPDVPLPNLDTLSVGPHVDRTMLSSSAIASGLSRRAAHASISRPKLERISFFGYHYDAEDVRTQCMESLTGLADNLDWLE